MNCRARVSRGIGLSVSTILWDGSINGSWEHRIRNMRCGQKRRGRNLPTTKKEVERRSPRPSSIAVAGRGRPALHQQTFSTHIKLLVRETHNPYNLIVLILPLLGHGGVYREISGHRSWPSS